MLYDTIISQQPLKVLVVHSMCMILLYMPVFVYQAVWWGHPDTSGVAAVDWYISSHSAELPGAEKNYSEKLYRMRYACMHTLHMYACRHCKCILCQYCACTVQNSCNYML